ncbi:methyltransferase domain-containing protein [Reyranella soli]
MPDGWTNRFGAAIALCVLDYVPDAARAVAEIGRTLRPGGTFLYWIQPYRIQESLGEATVVLKREGYRDPPSAYVNRKEEQKDYLISDCRFGSAAMVKWACNAALESSEIRILDHLGDLTTTFYVVRKPGT